MANISDKPGLYYNGELKAENYVDALLELYGLENLPARFCVDEDYDASGYSIIDNLGIQHIYELSPREFYNNVMSLPL